mmetsp:Transcript_9113/g.21579  ORF Transcript_9113/g.21579 Transcript_9113/m.21579 type:complete len:184 (+) Transcript_9113:396-947(+)
MDQFHRALSGGDGEPTRVVVSERIAATCASGMCPAEDCNDVEAGVDVAGGEGSNSESSGGDVLRARRTAACFGGWEYLVERAGSRVWVAHTRMAALGVDGGQLEEAQQQRPQAHSLRALLEMHYGHGKPDSVGQMEAAISGRADRENTELKLRQLANDFIAHAEDQREAELPGLPWPNLLSCE